MNKVFPRTLLIGLLRIIVATNVDVETARLVARNLYVQKVINRLDIKSLDDVRLDFVYEEKTRLKNSDESTLYYVFNVGENNGYYINWSDNNKWSKL